MREPIVSVLMPARNAAATIDASIESIRQQTLTDWELIVFDDGSTDSTAAIVMRHASEDGRIRLIQGPACGEPVARNISLAAAQGMYVAMLDADDLAFPARLEKQVAFLEGQPELVGCAAQAVLFVENGRPLGRSAVTGPNTIEELDALRRDAKLLVLVHPTFMFRLEGVRALGGYDERFFQGCDAELVNRAVYRDHLHFLVVPEPLIWYRITAGGMSSMALSKQRRVLRYLEQRNRSWVEGTPIDDFLEFMDRKPDRRTERRWKRHDLGAGLYRRGGMSFGTGARVRAVALVAAAAVLHPRYVVGKIWKQQKNIRRTRAIAAHQGGRVDGS